MLLRTQLTRFRARVSNIDGQQQIDFSIRPRPAGSIPLKADSRMVNDNLDYAHLRTGDPLDVLVLRFAEVNGFDGNREVIYKYTAVGIEKPQIHPFDIATLYPNGLECKTLRISKVSTVFNGVNVAFADDSTRITPLTRCFQAQQDEKASLRVLKSLKEGSSVNVWANPSNNTEALFYSVNYR